MVAKKGLVCDPEGNISSTSLEAPGHSRPSLAGSSAAPQTGIFSSDGLVSERQILKGKGCLERVIDTLLLSRKPVTRKIYFKVWKVFCTTLCKRKQIVSTSIPVIQEFLQDGVEKGVAINTL